MILYWYGFKRCADRNSSGERELRFEFLLSMVDGYESVPHTALEREMLGMRFEQAD